MFVTLLPTTGATTLPQPATSTRGQSAMRSGVMGKLDGFDDCEWPYMRNREVDASWYCQCAGSGRQARSRPGPRQPAIHQRSIPGSAGALSHTIARLLLTAVVRSEEHTSELQSLMRISYAVFCLKKKNQNKQPNT